MGWIDHSDSYLCMADMNLADFKNPGLLLSLLLRVTLRELRTHSRFVCMLMMIHEHVYGLHGWRSKAKFRSDLLEDLPSYRACLGPNMVVKGSVHRLVDGMTCMFTLHSSSFALQQ